MAYRLVLSEILVLGADGAGISRLSLLHARREKVLASVKRADDPVDHAFLGVGPHRILEALGGRLEHREDAIGAVPRLAAVVLDTAVTSLDLPQQQEAGQEERGAFRHDLRHEHYLALLVRPDHLLVARRGGDLLHLHFWRRLSTRSCGMSCGRLLGWHSSSIFGRLWHRIALVL